MAVRRRAETISVGSAGEDLPVSILMADAPGPLVAVTANVHGDEVTGLVAVQELGRRLVDDLVCGTVVLHPSLNPRGLVQQRRVAPDDGLDLNRAFPGDTGGRGTTRVAGVVWKALVRRNPDAVLDLHADSAVAIPYVIVDRATHHRGVERDRMDARMVALAEATGLTVLQEYPDDLYIRFRLDRSLAGAMVNHASVPAITLEVGPRRAVDAEAVSITVNAVYRVLHHLGQVRTAVPDDAVRIHGGPWRRAAAPRVRSSGLFVPSVPPGGQFAVGDVLGEIRAVDGAVREVVRAEAPGLVVSWSEHAWVDARGVPGTLGLLEEP